MRCYPPRWYLKESGVGRVERAPAHGREDDMGKREAALSSPSNASGRRAVSEENVEIVRRVGEEFLAAMERGDPGSVFDTGLFAADSEWVSPPFEGRRVWRGREGFAEFMRTWTEDFVNWSAWVERVIDAGGDRVVALWQQSATGKASGVPVGVDNGVVWELKDGRVIRGTVYGSHAEALEAAGLRK
jgi:ketosteroid isomerase-like protein